MKRLAVAMLALLLAGCVSERSDLRSVYVVAPPEPGVAEPAPAPVIETWDTGRQRPLVGYGYDPMSGYGRRDVYIPGRSSGVAVRTYGGGILTSTQSTPSCRSTQVFAPNGSRTTTLSCD